MHVDVIPLRLGIDGFSVIAADERDDLVEIVIETVLSAACCPHCGHGTARAKERKRVIVRDVPLRPGKQTWLVWWKRRFSCPCCRRTFTERHPEIPPRATHTLRFDHHLAVSATQLPYAVVADHHGVTFYRVDKAARIGAEKFLAARSTAPPTRLCIDEAAHLKGKIFNTIVSDPDMPGVVELIETRNQAPLQKYLVSLPDDIKAGIEEVAIDMWGQYRRAVRNALPDAVIVVDRFHVERIVARALNETRIAIQRAVRERPLRERKRSPNRKLFYARHKLLRAPERVTQSDIDHLVEIFELYPQLETAWALRWSFRKVYEASDRIEAACRLHRWYEDVTDSGLADFAAAAAAIQEWEEEVLAYFNSRLTNAFAEGMTNKIKVIKRTGYGFRNFESFRRRVLVACG
jgi:transposase